MYYSLNSLGVLKEDTRSLDYSSYKLSLRGWAEGPGGTLDPAQALHSTFPKLGGYHFGGSHDTDYNVLGCIMPFLSFKSLSPKPSGFRDYSSEVNSGNPNPNQPQRTLCSPKQPQGTLDPKQP